MELRWLGGAENLLQNSRAGLKVYAGAVVAIQTFEDFYPATSENTQKISTDRTKNHSNQV